MTLKPEMSNELRHMVRDVLREVMAQRRPAGSRRCGRDRAHRQRPRPRSLRRPRHRARDAGEDPRRASCASRWCCGPCPRRRCRGIDGRDHRTEDRSPEGRRHARRSRPDAVLTPLARDKARKLGLTIERRR